MGQGQLVQAATAGADEVRAALGLPASTARAGPGRLGLPVAGEGLASEQGAAGLSAHQHRASGRSVLARGSPATNTAGRTSAAQVQLSGWQNR